MGRTRFRRPHRPHRPAAAGAALAVVAGLLAACSGSSDGASSSAPSSSPPVAAAPVAWAADAPGFADPPDPLGPGRHGDLLRYQPVATPLAGTIRYRVLYRSVTTTGDPTVVTGLVAVPAGPAPPGGRPLVTHGHGSSGLADDCAPSVAVDHGDGQLAVETALVERDGTAAGYVVASTDYEGMGGPGRHPFLVGVSEGRSMLDIARAAAQLPDVALDGTTGIVGYSQGGHAALWAGQLAATWTPEQKIVGVVAGAPASELDRLLGPDGILQGPAALETVAGLATSDPAADLDAFLTPEGRRALHALDRTCLPPSVPATATTADLLRGDPRTTAPWRSLIAANTPGDAPGTAPILLLQGDQDRNVPPADSEVLLRRLCRHGATVERRIMPGQAHVPGAVTAYAEAFPWLTARRHGTPATTTCP